MYYICHFKNATKFINITFCLFLTFLLFKLKKKKRNSIWVILVYANNIYHMKVSVTFIVHLFSRNHLTFPFLEKLVIKLL